MQGDRRDLSGLREAAPRPRAYPSFRPAAKAVSRPAAAPVAAAVMPMGPPEHMEVQLDLQVMLRIASHCNENAPTVVFGELVGLETQPGIVEVSNCFQTPARRDIWNSREKVDLRTVAEKHSKEVEKYRANMRELLSYVDGDCQSVGWYQTLLHSAIADPAAIEQLYLRMRDVDPLSFILAFDLEKHMTGQFPFRALQLTPQYISLRRRQDAGELSSSAVLRSLASSEMLRDIKVCARNGVLTNCLLTKIPTDLDKRASLDTQMQLNSSGQLERGLMYLAQSLEDFTAETERLIRYQKDSSRFHQNLMRTIERKKNENEQRRAEGEDLLVIEEETTLSNFEKRAEIPNQLKSIMMNRQVFSMASEVVTLARQNVAASALIA